MSNLSSAAQAVLDAYANRAKRDLHGRWVEPAIAAALQAAADQMKRGPDHWNGSMPDDYDLGWNDGARYLLAIAAELDNTQPTKESV